MRYRISLSVFCLVAASVIASCGKHKPVTGVPVLNPAGTNITKELGNLGLDETQQALDGKWYLLRSSGGFAGQTITYSGVYHVFGKNVFTINDNGKVTNANCSWEKVKSIHSGHDVHQITYGGSAISFLRIVNDTLYTSDNAYDGYGSEYIKIK